MTIHVNIGEAKTRFSELCAAALRGEEVIVQRAGVPKLRLLPVESARISEAERIAAKRRAAFGKYRKEFEGFDLSIEAFQNLYPEYERKFDKL
jgi:antitoxin (DNA-binding transcriptional repressor) of toxin-antitoxin stability system